MEEKNLEIKTILKIINKDNQLVMNTNVIWINNLKEIIIIRFIKINNRKKIIVIMIVTQNQGKIMRILKELYLVIIIKMVATIINPFNLLMKNQNKIMMITRFLYQLKRNYNSKDVKETNINMFNQMIIINNNQNKKKNQLISHFLL